MRPPTPVHHLSHNKAERSPRHLIILDTESRWTDEVVGERHRLRCWVATHIHRHDNEHRRGNVETAHGFDVQSLAATISGWALHASSTWLYTHNTTFDLGLTRLPLRLGEHGWSVTDHALTLAHPWCRMKRGSHRLTIADSVSLLRKGLEQVGVAMGVTKLELPDNADSDEAWLARCVRDVDILAMAVLNLMQWWDDNQLGCWSLTGPACGWNAYRHRLSAPAIVIDPDPAARALERQAVVGGRRDVWRVGQQPKGRYYEIDFERAHLTTCLHLALPRKRAYGFVGEPKASDWTSPGRWGLLADVVVRTDVPRYPARIDGRVWHPTGTFRTTLAMPELEDARQRGDIVRWNGGYTYWLYPHMSQWAKWVASVLDSTDSNVPEVAKMAAKVWSRTVPGKWATRTSRTISTRPSPVQGWAVERGVHHPSDTPMAIVHIAGQQEWRLADQEAEDSFPAILAWVQSFVRLRLNRMLDALPAGAAVACNTDGLIVRGHRPPRLDRIAELTWPLVPRIKAEYTDVRVLGPSHLVLEGGPRMSGVPSSASPLDELRFTWHTWPGLTTQMELAGPDGYVRPRRTVDLSAVPSPRWVLASGDAVPPQAAQDAQDRPSLLPWSQTDTPRRYEPLRRPQHPALERALRDDGSGDALVNLAV